MPQKLQNRATAWGITVIVIAVSILLGGRSSLMKLRQEAWDVYQGNAGDYYSGIAYDLREILADSANLLTVAGRTLGEGDILYGAVAHDRELLAAATDSAGPRKQREAAERLRASLDDLDKLLETKNLSGEDLAYRNKLMVNIESRFATIEADPYNDLAAGFNGELAVFPARLLANLTGVEPLELYQ